jgi:hypothetical protein
MSCTTTDKLALWKELNDMTLFADKKQNNHDINEFDARFGHEISIFSIFSQTIIKFIENHNQKQ